MKSFVLMNHIGIFVTVFINQEYSFEDYAGLTLGVFFVKKAKNILSIGFVFVYLGVIHPYSRKLEF